MYPMGLDAMELEFPVNRWTHTTKNITLPQTTDVDSNDGHSYTRGLDPSPPPSL